ncbi:claudin-10 isoform X1 [Ictalurus punctatus]|uniref:Claudin-10 isoform X1 n=1 Tax=Ictalurus punctatus TaxID=7998 RepID=A0A2D0RZY3_ICTPU|nr:claudin-10 isoform X1 [Ictalurus punctatus]
MNYRTVVMYTEIGSFVTCVVGWILVCSTLPMEYWTFSEVASTVITTDHFHSNLWKDCTTDSTGMVDCKEFPTLLGLQPYIHLCRVLIIISILLGLFGAILALVGMKCTKLGGSEVANARVTFVAGINYLTSGLCSIFAYSLYGYKVVVEFFDPNYYAQKFELGAALYFGWSGSVLLIIGGLIYSIFGGKEGFHLSSTTKEQLTYSAYDTRSSEVTVPNKQATKHPSSFRPQIESKTSGHTSRVKGYKKNDYV